MPFKSLDPSSVITGRTLLVGAPNSQKSTAMLTWPKPAHIISAPGEKGHETLRGAEGVSVYVWETDKPESISPHQVVREIEELVFGIVGGKHGECRTLGIDGLHKLFGWYYRRARMQVESWAGADKMTEDVKGLRAYNPAYDEFQLFMTRVLQSPVPYIVMSVWEDRMKDNPDDMKSPQHIFPDMPGKMAKWIVGEFNLVLYSEVGLPDPRGNVKGEWTTKPVGKVWGVGVKVTPARAASIPAKLPNNFQALAKILGEAEE